MIHFRRVDEPFAAAAVERWQADYFRDDEGTMFPVGCAWIVVAAGTAQLNFVIVADEWRRQGIGKAIVRACLARWPSLQFTSGMSAGGRRLLASCREGVRAEK